MMISIDAEIHLTKFTFIYEPVKKADMEGLYLIPQHNKANI